MAELIKVNADFHSYSLFFSQKEKALRNPKEKAAGLKIPQGCCYV